MFQDRLPAWMIMIREFRHVKMAKRAGRAYDPGGIAATLPGSLAIPCRACPQPGWNLPPEWETARPEKAYVSQCLRFIPVIHPLIIPW